MKHHSWLFTILQTAFSIALLAVPLVGCGAAQSLFNYISAPPTPPPGSFAAFGVDYYPGCLDGNLSGHPAEESNISTTLTNAGWRDIDFQTDPATESGQQPNVTADSIVSAVNQGASAIFFGGHGNTGDILFSDACLTTGSINQSFWGVGSSQGQQGNSPPNTVGTPFLGHSIKWLFLDSSDTVAPDANVDPGDDSADIVPTGSWANLFGDTSGDNLENGVQTGASLRGVYGYWQAPGSCSTSNQYSQTRECDVTDTKGETAMTLFVDNITASKPQDLNDAWIQASQSAGMSHRWAIIQDCHAENDVFSGQNGTFNQSLGGNLCFTNPNGFSNILMTTPVAHATFTLEPQALQARVVDVPGLLQRVQEAVPAVGPISVTDANGVRRYETQGGLTVADYYGTSGGVVYYGHILSNPIQFSQADAITTAEQYINESSGMPGDAALSSIVPVYTTADGSGSRVLIAYELIWTHDNAPVAGGDAIIVDIDDVHTVTTECLQHKVIIPNGYQHPIIICVSSKTTVTDTPSVPYSYYLWREPAGTRQIMSAGRSTGQASIDAYTASLTLPAPQNVVSYRSGYWTGGILSGDSMEHPAWLFTLKNGDVVAVDAFSGRILGSND